MYALKQGIECYDHRVLLLVPLGTHVCNPHYLWKERNRQIFDSIQRSEFQVAFTAKEEFELFLFAWKGFQPPWLASGARAATLMPVLAYFQQLNVNVNLHFKLNCSVM
jgi:hypothetical protein